MVELLKPNLKPLADSFEKEFESMTSATVSLKELKDARDQLISTLHSMLTTFDREFLLDIKRGTANWNNFYYPHAEKLPAVAWKIINLDKMTSEARKSAYEKLEQALSN